MLAGVYDPVGGWLWPWPRKRRRFKVLLVLVALLCIPSSRVEGINFMMTSAEKFTSSSSGGGGWVVERVLMVWFFWGNQNHMQWDPFRCVFYRHLVLLCDDISLFNGHY